MSEGGKPDDMIDAEPDGGMRTAEAQRQVEEHGGPREVPVEQRRREQQAHDGRDGAATPEGVTPEQVQSSAPGQGADPDLSTGGES